MPIDFTETFPVVRDGIKGWPWSVTGILPMYEGNKPWPKISIVTPSFNQGSYIEETIRSVLLQNYPNLEYIIIDGGSTDNTIEIIKKYEPWITYWISEADRGQSHAINKGIERCTGDIFNWLNSDDWYMADTFFEVATKFMTDPLIKFVSGFENHIALNGTLSLYSGTFLAPRVEQTIEFCEVAQPSTFFKLNAIREIGGVSEDLHYIMDGEMWVKLLLLNGQHHFSKINKPVVNFRFHANSKTVSNGAKDNFLLERSSIIADLQSFIRVPERIVSYFIKEIYQAPEIHPLNRKWKFNNQILSPGRLRNYFIKKYVMEQLRRKKRQPAYWGIKQLVKNGAIDLFLLKSLVKIALRKH